MSVSLTVANRVKEAVASSVYDNPVLVREFRTRMRGWKAFIIMGVYVLLLAVCLFIHYMNIAEASALTHSSHATLTNLRVGARMFSTLVWAQVILLLFILPALTSGSLTHELERKTIDMLALTRLSAGKIVLGKHLSGFLYALMLLGCSVPLASMCMMFGGLSPAEVAVTYALLVTFSFLFTAMGVFWSSMFKNTAAAGVCSYGISLGYMILTATMIPVVAFSSGYGPSGMPHNQVIPSVALLNPVNTSLGVALANTRVCGLVFPAAIPSLALQIAIGALLTLVATTHVKYRSVDRALPIKLLLTLILSGLVWLMVGGIEPIWTLSGSTAAGPALAATATIILIICGFAAIIFSTGPVRNGKGPMILYALSGRKIFKSDIGGAVPFTAFLTACVYGTLGATLFWMAKTSGIMLDAEFLPACIGIGAAVVMMTVAIGAVGLLASTVIKQRNGAAALAVLFGVVMFMGYTIMLIYYQMGSNWAQANTSTSAIWQLAAFWPMTAIMGTIGEWDSSLPHLWWHPEESWRITLCAYAVLTFLVLALAQLARRKNSGVQED